MVFSLEHYYPQNSQESEAWHHVQKYTHTYLVDWSQVAYAARYESLKLFLAGENLYIPPRNLGELRELLERYAMSFMLTQISYLKTPLKGTDFSNMKKIAFKGLRGVVDEHQEDFIRLHSNRPDWFARKSSVVPPVNAT